MALDMVTPATKPVETPTFAEAVRLHNAGAFFEAHEAWEELWKLEQNASYRRFLQGLIQITAAFHKLLVQRGPKSAQSLLARGLSKLEPFPADYLGVALGDFRDAARACGPIFAALEADPAGIDQLDRSKIPVLRLLG